MINVQYAAVLPVGPNLETAIDTIESIESNVEEEIAIVIVLDENKNGNFLRIQNIRRENWIVIETGIKNGIARLTHSLSMGFNAVLEETTARMILRIDQDALVINRGLFVDAENYHKESTNVGLFGVYERDYDRPRSFESHQKQIRKEIAFPRKLFFGMPFWMKYYFLAIERGYKRGENVFGGAYFITRECLEGIKKIGGLNIPYKWNSTLMEDVYFSMLTIAAGHVLGHFAAPDGPLCMEWRGLPYPAMELYRKGYKLVHSVDKGRNTGPNENGGLSAREVFRKLRATVHSK